MPKLGEIEKGALLALMALFACTILTMPAILKVPDPSDDLFDGLTTLGTGLLLAYVVEISWLTGRIRGASDYERRLGFFVGLGASGLVGTVVALLLASHRAAGHSNLLDSVGLAWVVASLTMLGGLVIIHPLLVHEWSDNPPGAD